MISKKRLIRTIVAGILVICMAATPVFGLEGASVDGASDSQNTQEIDNVDVQEQQETIEEDMHFLYVESKEVIAPGTENIAVGWKEDINLATDVSLLIENPDGETVSVEESDRTDNSALFTMDFGQDDCGSYSIIGIRYYLGTEKQSFDFDQVKIDAQFKVTKAAEGEAILEIENGNINKTEIGNDVEEAIETASEEMLSTQSINPKNGQYYVVALDPGHSGSDCGAVNKKYGINERDTNYAIAEYCKAELEEYDGVKVVMTYPKGGSTDLGPRVDAAANAGADLMVSLHCNAFNGSARGGEIYYPNTTGGKDNLNSEGKSLSQNILNKLTALGISSRGVKTKNSEDSPGKDYYSIIRNARAKGILGIIVEHCFIDNNSDANAFLVGNDKLKKLGVADATGIAQYLGLSQLHFNEEGIVVKKDGTVVTNKFARVSGNTYRLDENGRKIIGFWSDDQTTEKKYYFGEDGIVRSNAFVTVDGKTMYLSTNGLIAKNAVISNGGYKYGLNSQGIKITNTWAWIGCSQYYFNGSGKAYINRSKAKKKVTVYKNPGSSKAGTYKKNRKFYVMRTSGKWSQMDNGLWIQTSKTKKIAVYPNMKPSVNKKYATKMRKKSATYTGPSTSYIKKKTYKKNKKVTVVGFYGSWAKLSTGYWVQKNRLK